MKLSIIDVKYEISNMFTITRPIIKKENIAHEFVLMVHKF